MAKSLLNNLLGKFGIGLEKAITKIISKEKYCEITKISVTTWKKTLRNYSTNYFYYLKQKERGIYWIKLS